VAFYTNLPAGKYRFHVSAYEINAPEKATERILSLEWRPHFYQTGWFLALCAALAASVAWGSYRMHVRNLRRRFAAVLDERSRLAREMHDTLVQGCLGVSTLLEAASRAQEISPQMSTELLDRARSEVRATVAEARTAIWDLRHGAEGGPQWVQAVAELAARTGQEAGLAVRCECAGAPYALGAEVEHSLTMVLREALQNSIKHAAPRNVSLRLRFEPRCLGLEVEDDGCGFDPAAGQSPDERHYGLIGMQERVTHLGGKLEIESAPGRGTRLRVRVPVSQAALAH
jgi:signal transduction histidine kinase